MSRDRMKAAILVRNLRARMNDPASSENEKEICRKRIKTLTEEHKLSKFHLRERASIGELKVKCPGEKAQDFIAVFTNQFLPSKIGIVDGIGEIDEYLVVGKKSLIPKIDRLLSIFLPIYESKYHELQARIDVDIKLDAEKGSTLVSRTRKQISYTWHEGFIVGLTQLIDGYKARSRQKIDEVRKEKLIKDVISGNTSDSRELILTEPDPSPEDIVAYVDQEHDKGLDKPQETEAKPILTKEVMDKYQGILASGYYACVQNITERKLQEYDSESDPLFFVR